MRRLLPEQKEVFHLQEYAVWKNENGTYEYMAWDAKTDKLRWIKGDAMIVEDVFCVKGITSEGEEETFETKLDVKFELNLLPKWEKTKYYCAVLGNQQAALPQYCETGEPVKTGEDDYNTVKQTLRKYGVILG